MNDEKIKMKLLQPCRLGRMELKNRIVMAPMETNYGTDNGFVSEQTKAHYEKRAEGGVGLIIVEATSIDLSRNRCRSRQLSIDDDKFIPHMRELVKSIHRHGAKVALQLQHGGYLSKQNLVPLKPVSASPIFSPDHSVVAVELTPGDIASVVELFAKAAWRSQEAGFDGVEIHGAHNYLIAQFLSATQNKRKDAYGGQLRNRARFLVEIIKAIRDSVGSGYPVWCRLNADETGFPGGRTLTETKELINILQATNIDALSLSGMNPSRTYYSPAGYFVHSAGEIKKVVSTLTTIVAGGINAQIGEKVLQENKADLVAMGRALLADPDLPRKLAEGRMDDIRPCLRCASCNDDEAYRDLPLKCVVNAALGKEREFAVRPAKKIKKVVVLGGGPAGLEAARVAATRGHDVVLFEKQQILGGQLILAATPPNKESMEEFRIYLITQSRKLGVRVLLNKEASLSVIQEISPDVVIIATGSSPIIPEISGIDRKNVFTVDAVLRDMVLGENVVIVGGGTTGCEAAHYLSKKNKKVAIVEILDTVAKNVMPCKIMEDLLDILAKCGVTIMTSTKVEKIIEVGLIVSDDAGNKKTIDADAIVLAAGRKPSIELFQAAKSLFPSVYLVGDAVQPGRLSGAIETAMSSALAI
jgi:2,4-dienoyl-CoA reductase-like NADH-dependent reductase (Old Yellow Enzyme family)/thioredoxin reductase